MSVFKQRKNKRFSYTPRHLKEQEIQIKEKLESKWRDSKHIATHRSKTSSLLWVLMVILGMIIVLWWVLDNYKI